jgi:SAM-dependent methyltransferase
MAAEMNKLIECAGPLDDCRVLDLGCASGETSRLLLKAGVRHLTVLDQSPQMVQMAKNNLEPSELVKFALCRVPSADRENIDLEGQRYELIVLHQGLPSLAKDVAELERLAHWCKGYSVSGGQLILAAHNTVVGLGDNRWADPFRERLALLADQDAKLRSALRPARVPFKREEIESAFETAGFKLASVCTLTIPLAMEERILMWQSPAVADSFIDVQEVGVEAVRTLVDKAAEAVRGAVTKERTVMYWKFIS